MPKLVFGLFSVFGEHLPRIMSDLSTRGGAPASVAPSPSSALVGSNVTPYLSSPTRSPGIRTPGIRSPGIRTPGIRTPGIRISGIRTPGNRTPGIRTPGIRTPGIRSPGIPMPGLRVGGSKIIQLRRSGGSAAVPPGWKSRCWKVKPASAINRKRCTGIG